MSMSPSVRRSLTRITKAQRANAALSAALVFVLAANLAAPMGALAAGTPTAAAGADRAAASGLLVTLDGSGSTDTDGATLSYSWSQTGGPGVTLTDSTPNGSKVEFVAPLVATATDLTFRLEVNNGTASATDDVKVTAVPGALPTRISLQPGRSGYQDIKASGRNVYVAYCYRNGGGLNIWFTKSFDGGATYQRPVQITTFESGDCGQPELAIDGDHVYIAWRQYRYVGGPRPIQARVVVARSTASGAAGTWGFRELGEGASDTSNPSIAASFDGVNHNLFVLYRPSMTYGLPLVLATSRDGGTTFSEDIIESTASWHDGMRDVAAFGDTAYVSYVAPSGDFSTLKLYSRCASTGAEQRGGFTEVYASGTSIAVSEQGRLAVAWESSPPGLMLSSASIVDTATLTGTKTSLVMPDLEGDFRHVSPRIAWADNVCFAAWMEMSWGFDDVRVGDILCVGRVRTGGGLTDAKRVHALKRRPTNGGYFGGLVDIAGSGDLVGVGWWDQEANAAFTAVSRDAGSRFESITGYDTWLGDSSGNVVLASNGSTTTPAVHATMGGNARFDEATNVLSIDLYAKRLGIIADNDLALEKFQVVQAPFDDSPTQRLAKNKKTAFRLDIANGYATTVNTRVEVKYTQVTDGSPSETTVGKTVTLPPFATKNVYIDGLVMTGDSVSAQATVNPEDSPAEGNRNNNTGSLSAREIVETKAIDGLYVPVQLPGDKAPDDAQFRSAVSGWGRYLAEVFPIDGEHWLEASRSSVSWTPTLTGYTPGTRLTSDQYGEIEKQLTEMAKASGHETVLGFVRPDWFKERAESEYSNTVGLAPFGGTQHVGIEQVGQPAQIGAHEIAHTYGLIPRYYPGEAPPDHDAHFDQLIATGYSPTRGEIGIGDPKSPTLDMMQWYAASNTWVSTQTYYLLMDALKKHLVDPEVILLTGTVDRSALTGALEPAYRYDAEPDVALGTTGDLQLVFKDGSDSVIDSAGFDPSFKHAGAGLSGTSETNRADFSVQIPWVTGTEKIDLVYDGTLIDSIAVSANAPSVTVASPLADDDYSVGETVTVSWSGSDADGGALEYLPMLSLDDGATWAPLCGQTTDTSCTFVPTRKMAAEKARVKVMVTDGANSSDDISGAFSISAVIPVGAGGGAPVWGALTTFPEPTGSPEDIAPSNWSLGANGSTVYAGWLQPSTMWDTKSHLRLKRSFDQGVTWEPVRDVVPGGFSYDGNIQSDVNLFEFFKFDGDNIYAMFPERIDGSTARLVFNKSTNGGASFDTSTTITTFNTSANPRLYRPHWLVDGDNVYLIVERVPASGTTEYLLYRSNDGGETFEAPVTVASGPWNAVGSLGNNPHMTVDGQDIYIAFQRGNTNQFGPPDGALLQSNDGGATFGAARVIITDCYLPNVSAQDGKVYLVGCAMPVADGLKMRVSDDYGVTFGTEKALSGGWTGDTYNCSPPAIFTNGDKVAVVWRGRDEAQSPIHFPVYSAASSDGGATFGVTHDLFSALAPGDVSAHSQQLWTITDDLFTMQGDNIYVGAHLQGTYEYPFGGTDSVRRFAVFTSTDFGGTWGAPDVFAPAELLNEDAAAKGVVAASPGFVYAGSDLSTYFTDFDAFVVGGSTGRAPAVSAGEDLSTVEGQLTSLTADFSADDVAGASAEVQWGDGTTSTAVCSGVGDVGVVDAAHAYGTYGTYEAKVTLTVGGQSAEDTVAVTVTDVAPQVSVFDTMTATTVGLPWSPGEIMYSDAGWDDPMSATIDWGDGSGSEAAQVVVTTAGGGSNAAAAAGAIEATHTYTAEGSYEALVTVSDGSKESTAAFTVLAQINHDPIAEAGGPYVIDEGSMVTFDSSGSADPDPDSLTFAWMLGATPMSSPLMNNRLFTTAFDDDRSTTVNLSVTDGRGGSASDSAALTVRNVDPSVTTTDRAAALSFPLLVLPSAVATFTDPGVEDTHTARVDWGDGSGWSPASVEETSGSGVVVAGHTYSAAGTYTVQVEVADKDGGSATSSFEFRVTGSGGMTVRRVAGSTGAQMALQSSREAFSAGSVSRVVMANAGNWPNCFAASGLAGTLRSPVLLTGSKTLPSGTYTELRRLGVKKIYLIGSTSSVGSPVTSKLKSWGIDVVRISGADRYAVARNVALKIEAIQGNNRVHEAFVVRGDNFYDAMVVSSVAYQRRVPVLYTPKTSLSSNTAYALRALGTDEVIIAGGTGVVSTSVQRTLGRLPDVDKVTRWAGTGADDTAARVAGAAVARGWATYAYVGATDLWTFSYAPAAYSAVGHRKGSLVFVTKSTVPEPTARLLSANKGQVRTVRLFGTTSTVSDAVLTKLRRLVE